MPVRYSPIPSSPLPSKLTEAPIAVAMVLVGFFFGPVTPKVLSAAGARVPPSLKASVMSLTIGLGALGVLCTRRAETTDLSFFPSLSLSFFFPPFFQVSLALPSARSSSVSLLGAVDFPPFPPS